MFSLIDSYSAEWQTEAAKRGLPNLKNTVSALATFDSKKNQELFASMKVLSPEELSSRSEIMYHSYIQQIHMEGNCQLDMVKTGIIPAVLADQKATADAVAASATKTTKDYVASKAAQVAELIQKTQALEAAIDASTGHGAEGAAQCLNKIVPAMNDVRAVCDSLERVCDKNLWPFPTYEQLCYEHHFDVRL